MIFRRLFIDDCWWCWSCCCCCCCYCCRGWCYCWIFVIRLICAIIADFPFDGFICIRLKCGGMIVACIHTVVECRLGWFLCIWYNWHMVWLLIDWKTLRKFLFCNTTHWWNKCELNVIVDVVGGIVRMWQCEYACIYTLHYSISNIMYVWMCVCYACVARALRLWNHSIEIYLFKLNYHNDGIIFAWFVVAVLVGVTVTVATTWNGICVWW